MGQRGWSYVLLGLLVSSFLGGAIRVFFSPHHIREFVEKVVIEKQPKFNIEFDSARLNLAGEWWPSIAIELSGIKIKASEPCITNSTFHADRLTVPFQLSEFFRKQVRFGNIKAGHVRVYLRPTLCESRDLEDVEPTDNFAPLERFFQKRWSKELINTARFLDKVSVEKLEVLRDNEVLSPVTLIDFEMEFFPEQGISEVGFQVLFGEPWVGSAAFGAIQTLVTIRADEVQLSASGNLKEGQLQARGQWAVDRGEASFHLDSQDVPVSSLLRLAHHWGILTSFNPKLKNQWATCDMSLAGEIRKIKELALNLHQCRLYGDFGEMNLKTTQLKSLSAGGELVFLVQNVDVKRALLSLDFAKNWGLVSQFGQFTGELSINGKNSYELKGVVRDSEFYISRLKNRARQKVSMARLDLVAANNRYSGHASEFLLPEGILEGGLTFNFSPDGDGDFQISFDKVMLPVHVQKAIWGGDVKQTSIYGHGQVQNSEVMKLDGDFSLSDLKSTDWALREVKSKFNFLHGRWLLSPRAKEFRVFPESKWSATAQKLSATSFSTSDELALIDLSVQLDIIDGGGHWLNFTAINSNRSIQIQSEGEWTNKTGISGVLISDEFKKLRRWSVDGTWAVPRIKFIE